MKKKKAIILVLSLFMLTSSAIAQGLRPYAVSVSYAGEMITHPGAKVALEYRLRRWNKVKKSKRGLANTRSKAEDINFGVGFFYHEDYQTALFVLPEYHYMNANRKGFFWGVGGGLGYMRSFVPSTYEYDPGTGEVNEVIAGHHYGLAGVHFSFGQDLYIKRQQPVKYFIKPQFLLAFPNYPRFVGYFLLEAGLSFKLSDR